MPLTSCSSRQYYITTTQKQAFTHTHTHVACTCNGKQQHYQCRVTTRTTTTAEYSPADFCCSSWLAISFRCFLKCFPLLSFAAISYLDSCCHNKAKQNSSDFNRKLHQKTYFTCFPSTSATAALPIAFKYLCSSYFCIHILVSLISVLPNNFLHTLWCILKLLIVLFSESPQQFLQQFLNFFIVKMRELCKYKNIARFFT